MTEMNLKNMISCTCTQNQGSHAFVTNLKHTQLTFKLNRNGSYSALKKCLDSKHWFLFGFTVSVLLLGMSYL